MKDPAQLYARATVAFSQREWRKALDMATQLLPLAPSQPNYRYNFAKSPVFLGDLDAAERELETCLGLAPWRWSAHLTLSQLRKQHATSNHLDRLHTLLLKTTANHDAQLNLHLALAKEYEDLADCPKAFENLVASKAAAMVNPMIRRNATRRCSRRSPAHHPNRSPRRPASPPRSRFW